MMKNALRRIKYSFCAISLLGVSAAVWSAPVRDTAVYQAMMPRSILVLPPVNESLDVRAVNSYWSSVTKPIADAGYYVFPISVVDAMLKENGISNGYDAQSISGKKLKDIFGADAALYLTVKEYGSKYQIVQTVAAVSVEAKLVDLKSGAILWQGKERQQQSNDSGGSSAGMILAGAILDQIANHMSDRGYDVSKTVSAKLFSPDLKANQGLLYGPRSPHFPQNSLKP